MAKQEVHPRRRHEAFSFRDAWYQVCDWFSEPDSGTVSETIATALFCIGCYAAIVVVAIIWQWVMYG